MPMVSAGQHQFERRRRHAFLHRVEARPGSQMALLVQLGPEEQLSPVSKRLYLLIV